MTRPGRVHADDTRVTARQAAATAAEAVRTLNHLTIRPPDLAELYAVLGELRLLTERLPQALSQLATALELPAGEYRTDNGDDPTAVTGAARLALRVAATIADDAGHRLADAHNATGHLAILEELAADDLGPGH